MDHWYRMCFGVRRLARYLRGPPSKRNWYRPRVHLRWCCWFRLIATLLLLQVASFRDSADEKTTVEYDRMLAQGSRSALVLMPLLGSENQWFLVTKQGDFLIPTTHAIA